MVVGDGAKIVEADLAAARQRDHGARRDPRRSVLAGRACGSPARARRSRRGRRQDRHWSPRSWRLTSPAVMPSASSRSGSRATRISRSTPPMRSTWATPLTPCSARTTMSSTNQDSCSGVIAGRARGIGEDRQAFDLEALDDRLVDGARQIGADAGDGVLDVVERAIVLVSRRNSIMVTRAAVGDRRGDVLDAVDAGDGVLDLLGHLRFRARRAPRPSWVDAHLDDRHVDVRESA